LALSDLTAAVRTEGRVLDDKLARRQERWASKQAARSERAGSTGIRGLLVFILIGVGLIVILSSGCSGDWRKCSDNKDLVNNYQGIVDAQSDCSAQAGKLAKYGTPQWPSGPFNTFHVGDDYPKTGIAVLIEQDAQFSNVFGAMVHSTAKCTYDLDQKKVLDVTISPN
jgi:hypothetical protein